MCPGVLIPRSFIPKEGFIMSPRQFASWPYCLLVLAIVATVAIRIFVPVPNTLPDLTRQFSLELPSHAIVCGKEWFNGNNVDFYAGNDTSAVTITNLNPGLTILRVWDTRIREFDHEKPIRLHGTSVEVSVIDKRTRQEIKRWHIAIS